MCLHRTAPLFPPLPLRPRFPGTQGKLELLFPRIVGLGTLGPAQKLRPAPYTAAHGLVRGRGGSWHQTDDATRRASIKSSTSGSLFRTSSGCDVGSIDTGPGPRKVSPGRFQVRAQLQASVPSGYCTEVDASRCPGHFISKS